MRSRSQDRCVRDRADLRFPFLLLENAQINLGLTIKVMKINSIAFFLFFVFSLSSNKAHASTMDLAKDISRIYESYKTQQLIQLTSLKIEASEIQVDSLEKRKGVNSYLRYLSTLEAKIELEDSCSFGREKEWEDLIAMQLRCLEQQKNYDLLIEVAPRIAPK